MAVAVGVSFAVTAAVILLESWLESGWGLAHFIGANVVAGGASSSSIMSTLSFIAVPVFTSALSMGVHTDQMGQTVHMSPLN